MRLYIWDLKIIRFWGVKKSWMGHMSLLWGWAEEQEDNSSLGPDGFLSYLPLTLFCPSTLYAIAIADRFSRPACMSSSLTAHARRFIPASFFFFFKKQLLEEHQKSSTSDREAPAGPTSQFHVYRQTLFFASEVNKYQEVCHISILLSAVLSRAWPSDTNRPPVDTVLLRWLCPPPPRPAELKLKSPRAHFSLLLPWCTA